MAYRPSRRQVLAGGLGVGAALPFASASRLPRWLRSKELHASSAAYKKLVLIHLNGANDWINNLVNPDEPTYAAARPTLRLPKASMVQLDSTLPYYIHPQLLPFKRLYDKGWLTMLPGIGYPTPNFSHFRSTDIWAEADPAARNVQRGWLADFIDKAYVGNDPIVAIDIENSLNRVFYGHPVPVLRSPTGFQFLTDAQTPVDSNVELAQIEQNAKFLRAAPNSNLQFVADIVGRVPADSALLTTTGASYTPRATYPTVNAAFARDLQLCARYITGGLTTPIYQVSIGGWDTHATPLGVATDPCSLRWPAASGPSSSTSKHGVQRMMSSSSSGRSSDAASAKTAASVPTMAPRASPTWPARRSRSPASSLPTRLGPRSRRPTTAPTSTTRSTSGVSTGPSSRTTGVSIRRRSSARSGRAWVWSEQLRCAELRSAAHRIFVDEVQGQLFARSRGAASQFAACADRA